MEEKDLQELERALRAATPPPWSARGGADLQWFVTGGNGYVANTLHGNDEGNAAAIAALRNKAPDLISALREARRLLGQCMEWIDPHMDAGLRGRIDAFLGEQNGKGSEGSNPVVAPTKEER